MKKSEVILLIGGNLGDRELTLSRAVEQISNRIGEISSISKLYETAPWGVLDQPNFLNQVIAVTTSHAPLKVLEIGQIIEAELGRVRFEKWSERTIDIDILYYDEVVLENGSLVIPHPLLQDRMFTLVPLNDILPNFKHPVLKKTTKTMISECRDPSEVLVFETARI